MRRIKLSSMLPWIYAILTFASAFSAAQSLPGAKPGAMIKLPEPKGQPVYPEAAKKRGIQGTILLAIIVSDKGTVKEVELIAGPAELATAAADAVRQWRFPPYTIDGVPSPVKTTALVIFRLAGVPEPAENLADLKTLADLYPVHEQCRYLVDRSIAEEALETCRESADLSDHLPPTQHAGYHILCWDEYGVLLLKQEHAEQALAAFDKECDFAGRLLKIDDKTFGIAFWHRALAQQMLKKNTAADADFSEAEKSLSAAKAAGPDAVVRRNAELSLNKVLKQHAALLDAEGRHADAERLRMQVAP